MHRSLSSSAYRANLAEAGKTEKQVDTSIRKAAENYAVRMVIMNHFDYADYAKSRALRSKPGRFFGQFQHYTFEFFEVIDFTISERPNPSKELNLKASSQSFLASSDIKLTAGIIIILHLILFLTHTELIKSI